jgi:hypothetical protein
MSLDTSLTDPVPVYDCHVLLTKPAAPGEPWRARCAAAPDVHAEGANERAVLQTLVTRFKFFLHEHRLKGEPIPWTQPELTPVAGEVERWIPVHL